MVGTIGRPGQSTDGGFAFRSDRLALDFAATRMFRAAGAGAVELLGAPDTLARWAVASGLVRTPPPSSRRHLDEAIELREAIYRIASSRLAGAAPALDDVGVLNQHGSRLPLTRELGSDGIVIRKGTTSQVLATIACDAIELFGGPDGERLRRCGREGCTRMFFDRTRGRTRMWCGMRECGNRVNAAAYRRRHAGDPGRTEP